MASTAITHTVRLSWTGGTGSVAGSVTASADAEDNRIFSVPAGSSDFESDINFTTGVTSFFAMATKNVTCEINAGTTAGGVISLIANVPYWYNKDAGHTSPFTTTVTSLFFTNATTVDAQVDLRVLYDSTPTTA